MAAQHSLQVTLTKPLASFVAEQVHVGCYATSKSVRDALWQLIEPVNADAPKVILGKQARYGKADHQPHMRLGKSVGKLPWTRHPAGAAWP